jgi:hypothetical protein
MSSNIVNVKKMAAEYEERVKSLKKTSKPNSKYIEVPINHELTNNNDTNKDYDLETVNIMITDIIHDIIEKHTCKTS